MKNPTLIAPGGTEAWMDSRSGNLSGFCAPILKAVGSGHTQCTPTPLDTVHIRSLSLSVLLTLCTVCVITGHQGGACLEAARGEVSEEGARHQPDPADAAAAVRRPRPQVSIAYSRDYALLLV